MKYKNWIYKIIGTIVLLLCIVSSRGFISKAAIATDSQTGNLTFSVTERAATGGLMYRTIGFEIKRCVLGTTTRHPSGDKLMVNIQNLGTNGTFVQVPNANNGTITSHYTFNRSSLLEAIKTYYPTWYAEVTQTSSPQYLIFDGIMITLNNGVKSGELGNAAPGFQKHIPYVRTDTYPKMGTGTIFGVYDYDGGEWNNWIHTNNPSSLMNAYAWGSPSTILSNFNIVASFNPPVIPGTPSGSLATGRTLIQNINDLMSMPSYYTGNKPVNEDFNWSEGYIPVLEKVTNTIQADNWFGSVNYQQFGERVDYKLKFQINYTVQVEKKKTTTKTSFRFILDPITGLRKRIPVTKTVTTTYYVTEPRMKEYETMVSRSAYYWAINQFYLYELETAAIKNNSFPYQLNYVGPKGTSYSRTIHGLGFLNHVNWAGLLPSGFAATQNGYTYTVTIPITASSYESGVTTANNTKESYIKQPVAVSDTLIINGKTYLNGSTHTYQPFSVADRIGVERSQTVEIPYHVKNGYYGTLYAFQYRLLSSYNVATTSTKTFSEEMSMAYADNKEQSDASKKISHVIQFEANQIWSQMK